jgi:hypothetical protein
MAKSAGNSPNKKRPIGPIFIEHFFAALLGNRKDII